MNNQRNGVLIHKGISWEKNRRPGRKMLNYQMKERVCK